MATKKKTTRKNKKVSDDNSFLIISLLKKKKVIGLLISVFSFLILLSILSYSRKDLAVLSYDFSDFFKIFSSDSEFFVRAGEIHNWLGIFGAYISNFFINSTIGYFAVVFPAIMFIWGYTIFKNSGSRSAIYLSNWLLIISVISSSLLGSMRAEMNIWSDFPEITGKIGGFFGIAIGTFLGGIGSFIFLTTLLLISISIAFDVKYKFLVDLFDYLVDTFSSNESEKEKSTPKIKKVNTNRSLNDLSKTKKKKKTILPKILHDDDNELSGNDVLQNEEEIDETRIRIIKNSEPEILPQEESEDEKLVIRGSEKIDQSKKTLSEVVIPDVSAADKDEKLPEPWDEKIKYSFPKIDLLLKPKENQVEIPENELTHNAELLKEKLSLFDIQIVDISVTPGPVVTLYEIVPAPGVKISRIVSLENDIALALAARGIRIIAPIPGKSAIGVEIPNSIPSLVSARQVLSKIREAKADLPIALGKTINGEIYVADLAEMPHLLIAGSTGSGKSVGINMLITSLLYSKHPRDIKFVIIDPKKIELSFYRRLHKHHLAVSPDIDEDIITLPQNALLALKAVEYEMDKRYDKLAKAGVRHIKDYNLKVSDPKKRPKDTDSIKHHPIPYIVVIIDELADLMITSGKEVEEPIARIAQLARAVGIHLVVATQRPSVNVITGVIKANFPARMAFQVASKIDSRTILDMKGAEALLGKGDMLYLPGGMPKPVRIQNAFISTEEVERITNYIYIQKGFSKRFLLPSMFEKKKQATGNFLSELDDMFEDAARVIVKSQQGSVSLLQRRLKLGYARAARIVDQLEEAGIVGPNMGSKAREVLVDSEEQLEAVLRSI